MRYLPLYEEPPRSAIDTSERLDVDPSCLRCPLSLGARNPCLAADGDAGGVLVVGEYPGRAEDAIGRPHAGDAGRVLRNMVAKYWSGPAAFDYAVRCSPGRGEVKPKHVEACRPYLARAVDDVAPKRILATGSAAAYALFGRSVQARENRRGYAYLFPDGGDPIPVFFLPSYTGAARNRFLRRYFEEDLAWALRCPPPALPPIDGAAWVVETAEDAALAVADLRSNSTPDEPASFDVETCGLLFDTSFQVLSLSACGAGESDAWVWDRAALGDPKVRAPLLAWLADPSAPKTGTNVKFDENAVQTAFGVNVQGVVGDVRLHRKLLAADASGALDKMVEHVGMGGMKEENEAAMEPIVKRVRKGLEVERRLAKQREENAALVRAGSAPKKERALSPEAQAGLAELRRIDREMPDLARLVRDPDVAWQAWAYALVPPEVLTRYNARDVVGTDRVRAWVAPQLRAESDIDAVRTSIVDRAAHAVRKVEAWGIAVDRSALDAFDAYLAAQLVPVRARLDTMAGPDFNPLSPQQCGELLFDRLGLRHDKRTRSGQQSTDGQVLEDLAGKHPVANAILEYRTIAKMRGTYASGMTPHIRSDGRIHTSILLDGAGSGRTSSQNPNCFDAETEILTPRGWVRFADLGDDDSVAQWEPGGRVSFVKPLARFRRRHVGELVRVKNDHIDLALTPDHRCLTRDRKTGALRVYEAARYPKDAQQIHAGVFNDGGTGIDPDFVRLAVATQADGSWHCGGIDFCFTKQRKFDRIRQILDRLGASYSSNPDQSGRKRVRVLAGSVVEQVRALLGADKVFGPWVLDLSRVALDAFVEEVWHWDGCFTRMNHYASKDKRNADVVQAALTLSGCRARLRRYENSVGSVSWQVDVTRRDYSLTANADVSRVPYDGDVFCVEVPSSYVVVRRGQDVAVTGNCQNLPRAKDSPEGKMARDCFVAQPGYLLLELDYSQLELRVAAMLSRDPLMRQIFAAGLDYHQRTAELISQVAWGIVASAVTEVHRTRAKAVNFGILYGKTARTLAKEWGVKVEVAERIVNAIMGQFKVLAAWCEAQLAELRRTGEIWTWWAGRKARRRPLWRVADPEDGVRKNAENSAVNTPVQGTASEFCVASLADVVDWVEGDGIEEDCRPVLPIHDALVLEVRRELVIEAAETTRDIMLAHDSDGVPLDVDAKVGRAFGSMVKFPIGDRAGCRSVLDKLAA